MKEKVNEAAVLLSRMLNGTLNQDWRGVERAAKELKNIFVMTDRHEFESDKDGTFESACQESSLNQIDCGNGSIDGQNDNRSVRGRCEQLSVVVASWGRLHPRSFPATTRHGNELRLRGTKR